MTRDDLLARLEALKPWLAEQGVDRVRLFGSHARDEAGPGSDVDLIVDFVGRKPDLWSFVGLRDAIAERLGVPIDLTTSEGLHLRLRDDILASAIDA